MKRLTWLWALVFAVGFISPPAPAQLLAPTIGLPLFSNTRLIVRDTLGLGGLNITCLLLGCKVKQAIEDPSGQLFVITTPSLVNPILFIAKLLLQPGISAVEIDQSVGTQAASAGSAPSYLSDRTAVSYYGSTVWEGYVTQPAVQLIRSDAAHSVYNATGAGATVAVIDTVAVLDTNNYAAFGHGTMTAGVVHLVAPRAKIMPLKAFKADGSGYASDVLRAIYYAVKNGADVLGMSFDFTTYSPELKNAINYANNNGSICVASAGNDGQQVSVYPAALSNVIDVASTSNQDTQSTFTI